MRSIDVPVERNVRQVKGAEAVELLMVFFFVRRGESINRSIIV